MYDHDVAVVGLGPVGSTAAILFARAGLRVLAIEREPEVYRLPRAVSLDGEIVRAFQAVALGQAVARLLQPIRPGDRAGFCNSRREWLFGQESRVFGRNGWPPSSMFDQPELEGFLRAQALAHPQVTARIGHELIQFQQAQQGVQLTTRTAGQTVVTSARYLVGCDGAGSFVRRQLGVGWQDLGYDRDWLVVDVTLKSGHTLGSDVLQICDPDRLSTFVGTKDPYRRWEFRLNPGETAEQMLDPAMIHSLIEPWTPAGTYEIRRTAVYQFHAAIAERWQVGNVLLAGDAAHQSPPFIGQGMNAGMRDVVNLAWKLPLIINGDAAVSLLQTYQRERAAHARDLVDWAVSLGRLMEHLAAVEAAEQAGRAPPPTPAAQRSAGYGQGREAPPLRDGVVVLEQISDTGSTGYLFPQPEVAAQPGQSMLLDDLLDGSLKAAPVIQRRPGFTLVGRSEAALELDAQATRIAERIGLARRSICDLTAIRGRFDPLFESHEAALVRPDRYLFGHTTDALSASDLVRLLAAHLQPVAGT